MNIVERLYPQDQIFVREYFFDDENFSITSYCVVPDLTQYTKFDIPYVTAENYVRCLSQSCNLLAENVLDKKLIDLDIDVENFRSAAESFELYYRSLAMNFHSRVRKGVEFETRFTLKNWREIKKINDFILFTFTNERTVISGEMSFVVVR